MALGDCHAVKLQPARDPPSAAALGLPSSTIESGGAQHQVAELIGPGAPLIEPALPPVGKRLEHAAADFSGISHLLLHSKQTNA